MLSVNESWLCLTGHKVRLAVLLRSQCEYVTASLCHQQGVLKLSRTQTVLREEGGKHLTEQTLTTADSWPCSLLCTLLSTPPCMCLPDHLL